MMILPVPATIQWEADRRQMSQSVSPSVDLFLRFSVTGPSTTHDCETTGWRVARHESDDRRVGTAL
jgi:hypothetical protein